MNKDLTIANLKYPDTRKLEEYWKKRYNSGFHYKVLGRMNTRNDSALSDKIARIYEVSDNILHDIFNKHPSNTPKNIEYVFLKVKLVSAVNSIVLGLESALDVSAFEIKSACVYELPTYETSHKILLPSLQS